MIGNISKSKGFKGDTGAIGPQGPQGIQGVQGVKGDTPALVLRYEQDTGNLYYNSDGILVEKEWVETQNIVTKNELSQQLEELHDTYAEKDLVINLNSAFAGDKTYDEIVTAYKAGREIIGVMPDMNMTFRFLVTAYSDSAVQLMTQMLNSALILGCTSDNVWIAPEIVQFVTDTQLKSTLESTINNKISGLEKTSNKVIQITENSTSNQYPTAKAVYNLVNTTEYDLQTQIDSLQDDISDARETNNSQALRIGNLESSEERTQESITNIYNLMERKENKVDEITDNYTGENYPTVRAVRAYVTDEIENTVFYMLLNDVYQSSKTYAEIKEAITANKRIIGEKYEYDDAGKSTRHLYNFFVVSVNSEKIVLRCYLTDATILEITCTSANGWGRNLIECAIKTEVDEQIGDIETVLDNIIAIQNEFIGGDSV